MVVVFEVLVELGGDGVVMFVGALSSVRRGVSGVVVALPRVVTVGALNDGLTVVVSGKKSVGAKVGPWVVSLVITLRCAHWDVVGRADVVVHGFLVVIVGLLGFTEKGINLSVFVIVDVGCVVMAVTGILVMEFPTVAVIHGRLSIVDLVVLAVVEVAFAANREAALEVVEVVWRTVGGGTSTVDCVFGFTVGRMVTVSVAVVIPYMLVVRGCWVVLKSFTTTLFGLGVPGRCVAVGGGIVVLMGAMGNLVGATSTEYVGVLWRLVVTGVFWTNLVGVTSIAVRRIGATVTVRKFRRNGVVVVTVVLVGVGVVLVCG